MKYLGEELNTFSQQINYALDNYYEHKINKAEISHVVLCGLGGSGIAGKIVKNYFLDKIDLPVELVSDYTLPRFVNEHSLVILCSYSGNTEETLAMYDLAKEKGAKIIVITSGGQLAKNAMDDHKICYSSQPGFQPRMALGYPLIYLLLIFFELMDLEMKAELKQIAEKMKNVDDFQRHSLELVGQFTKTITHKYVIASDVDNEGIAIRFAQQINENAKIEAFVVVLPEANHNVIESYYSNHDTNFIFLNSGSNQRTNLRMFFVKELLKKYDSTILEIFSPNKKLGDVFNTIYTLDWMSLQIADMAGAISNKIDNIVQLKDFLNKN